MILQKYPKMVKQMKIEALASEERLDVFIAREAEISRSQAADLLQSGAVTLDGKPLKKNARTIAGAVYELQLPEPETVDIVAQDIPLSVVFEDNDVIVIDKPKGLVVHPAPGHSDGTLVNALLHHCGSSLSGINGQLRPGIVHRIDKDTSGLLIVAKNDNAHRALADQLADHSLSRVYEAIVCGRFKELSGTIDAPIGRHPADRKKMAVVQRGGRNAVTHYEVIAEYRGYSHIRCRLETGRTHQIRVHMASVGHPILGDMVYGHKKPELGQDTQCLHARQLKFVHPVSGELIDLSCPLPEYFSNLLDKLNSMS